MFGFEGRAMPRGEVKISRTSLDSDVHIILAGVDVEVVSHVPGERLHTRAIALCKGVQVSHAHGTSR